MPGPEQDDVQATCGSPNGSTGTISYVTGGNARFPKETLDAAGGGRSARLDNFQQAAVWTGRRADATQGRAAARTRASGTSSTRSSRPSGPARPMPIALDSLVATTRATIAVGESLPSGRPGAGVSVSRSSRLGWYVTAAAPDVAGRGGLARPRPGAPAGLVAPAGAPRAGRRAAVGPAAGGRAPVHRACCPPGAADAGARGSAEAAVLAAADRLLRGRVGGAGRRPDRHGAARLVPRPGDRPPGPGRTGTRSGSTTAPRSRPATSSRSGRSPGCSTSRCWPRPGT